LNYADDIVFVANSETELVPATETCYMAVPNGAASDIEMRTRKTEVIIVCDGAPPMSITVIEEPIYWKSACSITSEYRSTRKRYVTKILRPGSIALARKRIGRLDPLL